MRNFFLDKEASVVYEGKTYTSPPLLDQNELISEWKFFRQAFHNEKTLAAQTKQSDESSTCDVLFSMQATDAYKGILPQMFTLLDILMSMPIGTATVERSFSQTKLTKTRLRNRLFDINLCHLMRNAVKDQN